jgi:hypothetical protein
MWELGHELLVRVAEGVTYHVLRLEPFPQCGDEPLLE